MEPTNNKVVDIESKLPVTAPKLNGTSSAAFYQQLQQRMLPFTKVVLVLLGAYFILASTWQLYLINTQIGIHEPAVVSQRIDDLIKQAEHQDALAVTRLIIQADLERTLLSRRYHQANVFLMSRIWIQYLSFLTGMILAIMGGVFILGQLRTSDSRVEAEAGTLGKFSFNSASPGVVLAVLGCCIILAALVTVTPIEIPETAVYLDGAASFTPSGVSALPYAPAASKTNSAGDIADSTSASQRRRAAREALNRE